MQQANLSGSQILISNFSGADLRNADLRDALIEYSNFSKTDLRGANLDRACIKRDTVWTGALLDDKWAKFIALRTRDVEPEQDLRGYDLSNVCVWAFTLNRVNLLGVNLRGAMIRGSSLIGANLAQSDLRDADLGDVDLQGADLTGADLTGATLINVNLRDAIVTQEQLNSAAKMDCVRLPDGSIVPTCYGDEP